MTHPRKHWSLLLTLALLLCAPAVLAQKAADTEAAKAEAAPAKTAPAKTAPAKTTPAKTTPAQGVEAIDQFIASQKIDKSNTGWKLRLPKPPKVGFDAKKQYFWHMQTNVGVMKIKLLPDVAPMHVSSTIYLTRLGFFDGLPFHRVIPGFMAQGGDPRGNGTGGPGYRYGFEALKPEKHDRPGLLSMANAGPGTDGSQFFLTFVATPHLDGKHTIFGEVVEGKGTLQELEKFGSRGGRTSKDLKIIAAAIRVE
ncbi:MAG: peptidylprolyl isomerase [Deltaproteobacteria bacterium]|nr:peptidylprolyl isomerase [Deltaproteobacteria bacterium]